MKGNLSKTKLTKIVICTLMIATILQVTAISMVQATSENIDNAKINPMLPEDIVRIDNQDVDFVKPEDGSDIGITQVRIMPENGDLTVTDDQEIDFVKPEDGSDLGITQIGNEENSQPLIAPKTISTETPTMGAAVLLVALATIASAFVIVGHKKTK
ncbi:MAG: hypothetical protein NUK63_04245 [Candidatus Bathyarchaeum tardum]|nr:MAG: hypothetical protein NUK63_04245 [Candidatus Bathyarchaeum tardum]